MPQTPGPSTSLRWWTIAFLTLGTWSSHATADSLRYFGGFSAGDVNRVKIPIDNPDDNNPGTPADVGSTDFTVEFFMKAAAGQNNQSETSCNQNAWTNGNIIIDRDRFGQERDYGISLGGGRVNFGVTGPGFVEDTLCATSDTRDGQWHHVAVQRRRSDGRMEIFVDGTRQAQADGPDGDISYPDNGVPSNSCGPGGGQSCRNSDPFLVIGAEKHDVAWGFAGWVDELRLSTVLRYPGNFTPPSAAFVVDANTAALYHFDEGAGDTIVDANGDMSPGVRRFGVGGGSMAGPAWSTDSPFNPSAGTLQFSQAQYSVQENVGQATVTVTRAGGSSGAASVSFTTADGAATAGADYSTVMTTLNWISGDATSRTVQIPIIDDATPESAESFSVQLSGASGATLGGQSTATVTIAANDQVPAPGSLQWSAATATVSEAAGSITLTVNRVGGSDGAVGISYSTANGSATAGADYTSASATLSFAAGVTSRTVSIPISEDALVEGAENFTVTLATPTGGATLGMPSAATVTINDNDQAPGPGSLQWSATNYAVAEGSANVTLTVNRVAGSAGAVTVNYVTSDGTAVAGSDYTTASASLSFADGETTRTITVPILDDGVIENAETLTVTLSAPGGGATLGNPTAATVTITDNDQSPPPGGGGGGGGAAGWWELAVGLLTLVAHRKRWAR